ncbi:DUF983 domain-containing protein [Aridibaculum aurantiacum]|uniref:DUF983 domain-containing protein n=1 Tax=Aridibaculum aurantiacum TaxID=2810307 RepID=UPI001A96ECE4|nr:DUF983 domain-containing protein [Aridibaculum aurantiacum]
MSETKNKPLYLWSVLTNRCPRCRQGKLFVTENPYDLKKNTAMHEKCPECGQPTEIEVGFYYGTSYVSYALTVAFSGFTFVAWWVLIGFSLYDNRIFYWLGLNAFLLIVLQPVFMRLSRSMWLSWFVKYNPNWKQEKVKDYERIVKEQMNNW